MLLLTMRYDDAGFGCPVWKCTNWCPNGGIAKCLRKKLRRFSLAHLHAELLLRRPAEGCRDKLATSHWPFYAKVRSKELGQRRNPAVFNATDVATFFFLSSWITWKQPGLKTFENPTKALSTSRRGIQFRVDPQPRCRESQLSKMTATSSVETELKTLQPQLAAVRKGGGRSNHST